MKASNILNLGLVLACVGYTDAGEGGSAYLINLSDTDWNMTHTATYQMHSWDLPYILKNGETIRAYVEFDQGIFDVVGDDHGETDYVLVGTGGKSFRISAQGGPFRMAVTYSNLELQGRPKGFEKSIGWHHDGDNNIILIKTDDGTYTGTGLDGSDWMKSNIHWLGHRTLRQISMPGSHDAGMSKMDGKTFFAKECNVLTQSRNIRDQLNLGSRYFDIRPVIGNGGQYLTGHYSHGCFSKICSWQGANGESIDSIVSGVNDFTNGHNELVIMKLSHALNTDIGSNSYREFIQSEWDGLFQKLDKVNHRFYSSDPNVDLTKLTLNDFTKNGTTSAVLFFVDGSDSWALGSRLGRGYFNGNTSYHVYDDYSNTHRLPKMVDDQLSKMANFSKDTHFLLSWTLTQSIDDAINCGPDSTFYQDRTSIRALAKAANNILGSRLYEKVSKSSFPNIIYVDYIEDTDVAALSLAINAKVKF